ncbi:SDR family oxidoreductase [Nocardioides mangrovicus]|uniref:SDR family oxidoreductase n=1 Tax=Nocardioides mangrovicus TaxID=2478913 RepID=A0A3L8P3D8_9ACTN|nr:SDR family oxidoreductase [Nocardioides mangrovicus]RLV49604.1 SDR family oxidoreductase [Nocardioides mangrovicus]
MTEGLEGRVVVVTGASSGIGEAIALHLAERGAHVVLGARGEDALREVAGRIESAGGRAVHRATDVRRREDVEALVATAREHFGGLDVMVSNAGAMPVSLMDDLRVDDWDLMIDVNLRGVLHGIAAALPVFREQGRGHFVHIASTAAYKVVPQQALYAATKTAVRVLTDGLRQELAPDLRVSLVSPGFTHTEGIGKGSDPEIAAAMIARRDEIAMPPEAVARAVAYALEQPESVDVGEIVLRSTAQA